ncbi:MAG: stage III sporulation protein AF [Clostridia bacterium]|nr:stage III sporulation protein AF [Clostridia bacterium]
MKEYIISLIYVAVFSIILEVVLPDTKLKKYISTMIGLLVIIVTISPIIDLLNNEDVLTNISRTYANMNLNIETLSLNYDENMYGNEHIKYDVKRKIELDILNECNTTGILANRVNIVLTDEYLIKEVNIYVSDVNTVEDANKIIRKITDKYELKRSYINVIKGE